MWLLGFCQNKYGDCYMMVARLIKLVAMFLLGCHCRRGSKEVASVLKDIAGLFLGWLRSYVGCLVVFEVIPRKLQGYLRTLLGRCYAGNNGCYPGC